MMDLMLINVSDFEWKPPEMLPLGAVAANVFGDPSHGNYDFFAKFPAGYTVPMHWHTNDIMVVIMTGSMVISRDDMPDVEIKQGGFFMIPGGMRYIAHCPEESIFLEHGCEPLDIFYAHPEDDPR